MKSIPKVIGEMKSLKKIDLCNNRIEDFDDAVANAKKLEVLMVDFNPIDDVKVKELRILLPKCNVYTGKQ